MKTERVIPSDYKPVKETKLVQFYKKECDQIIIKAFVGKQSKPTWHYRFRTEQDAQKRMDELEASLITWEIMKRQRKEERQSAILDVEIGDIFSYSWGYEQTNVDFYQVTEKKGKTFIIRQIARRFWNEAPSGGMSDYVSAVPNAFLENEEPILKRNLSMKFGVLSKTTADEKHFCSWYA